MIEQWKSDFEDAGYAEDGGVYLKDSGVVRRMIAEAPLSAGAVALRISIALFDRYLEPPAHVTALVSSVNREGVVSLETGGAQSWSVADALAARDALLSHGLPWLERIGDLPALIAFLENTLTDGIADQPGLPPPFLGDSPRGIVVRRPPVYRRWLALLYAEAGNPSRACDCAREWYERARHGAHAGEPQRTLRQLADLGC